MSKVVTKNEIKSAIEEVEVAVGSISGVVTSIGSSSSRNLIGRWFSNRTVETDTYNERVYLGLLNHLVQIYKDSGEVKSDRTNTGTYSDFGPQCVYDLRKGFPLLTTKAMRFKSIWIELIWFLKGDTRLDFLHKFGVHIWDEWANAEGDLGPIYGEMWRDWGDGHIDQISNLLHMLKRDPDSRRMIVTGWDPDLLPKSGNSFSQNISLGKQALPPCHTMWQVYTSLIPAAEVRDRLMSSPYVNSSSVPPIEKVSEVYRLAEECSIPIRYLDLKLYQRSGDVFLGVPYNVASYSLLMLVLCTITGYLPRYFIHTFGDVHLYSNHVEQAMLQLSRTPKPSPVVTLNDSALLSTSVIPNLSLDFFLDNPETSLLLLNYESHPSIPAPVAV